MCQSRLESREPYSFRYETDLNSPLGHCGPYICPQRERLTLSTLSFFTYISYVQIRYTRCALSAVPSLCVASSLLLSLYCSNLCLHPFLHSVFISLTQTVPQGICCHRSMDSHINTEVLAWLLLAQEAA